MYNIYDEVWCKCCACCNYIHVYTCFLANYPWSPVSQWVKPIFQFHPPVFQPIWHILAQNLQGQHAVEKSRIHSSVRFLGFCQNTSDWICGFRAVSGWLAVPLPLHHNNAGDLIGFACGVSDTGPNSIINERPIGRKLSNPKWRNYLRTFETNIV